MKFKELKLKTNDLEKVKNFYGQQLNLGIVTETNEAVTIQVGQTTLTFELSDIPNPIYHYAINVPENQFAEACNWLRQRVDTLLYENSDEVDFQHWNAHAIYFYDSVGNIGELIARHDSDNATDEPFSVESLLEISEIGLPTKDVIALTNVISQHMEIVPYKSGGTNFQPLGDESGLFICVISDRLWFPTAVKANIFPIEIILKSEQKIDFEFETYKFKS